MADETLTLDAPPDWRASLPEELKAEKSLESFKDVGALAKSYVETKRMVGNALVPPGEKATPEEHAAFWTKLGRPEAPDKYKVRAPEFPETMGLTWDKDLHAAYLAEAHAAGLSDAQAQRFIDWYARAMMRNHDSAIAENGRAQKAAEGALRQAWGAAHDRNLGLARAAVHKLFADDPEVLDAFEAKGNNPALVRGLHLIGEILFERGEIRGDALGGARTEEELEGELQRIREDPKNAGSAAAADRILALTTELLNLRDRRRGR